MKASIIIVTRNRAPALARTLAALRQASVPEDLPTELLVLDNGSTDETPEVVRTSVFEKLVLRYVLAPDGAKAAACNRGLAEAKGEVLLFLDDDVRPPADWLVKMCEALLDRGRDAVAGGVKLAPHLLRPWMTRLHRSWLASTEWLQPGQPQSLVGANMGIARRVLERVPAFDPALGPGALGFGEDSLFATQLLRAGYTIADGLDICVEHHFEPRRLLRQSWLDAAERRGRVLAYRGHHWEHWSCRLAGPRWLRTSVELGVRRALQLDPRTAEGCSERELKLVFRRAQMKAHLRERKTARAYRRPTERLTRARNHTPSKHPARPASAF